MEFFPEEALRTAASLDEHLAKTGMPIGPLHGLPVCLKDMWDCQGHRSTFGFVAWYDQIAEKDAVLVKHLRESGAVFHAKTTMPQTGMMLETKSNLWGTTHNPFNRSLLSGGSSGGDGVLVAMKGSPISPSTDIGGSIRVPAAYNGNYSIKPTAERVPRRGLRSPAPGNVSIKVSCGPQCHSMADAKMFTRLLNAYPASKYGYEPGVATVPWRDVQLPKGKLCIGLWETDGVVTPQPPIQRALKEAVQLLTNAGHEGNYRSICNRALPNSVSSHPDHDAVRLLGGSCDYTKTFFSNRVRRRQGCPRLRRGRTDAGRKFHTESFQHQDSLRQRTFCLQQPPVEIQSADGRDVELDRLQDHHGTAH